MPNCPFTFIDFISGLSSVIWQLIIKEIADVEIIQIFDGLIIYKTKDLDKVSKLKFVNNTFCAFRSSKNKFRYFI